MIMRENPLPPLRGLFFLIEAVKPYLRVHILSKFWTRLLMGRASGMASDCPWQGLSD